MRDTKMRMNLYMETTSIHVAKAAWIGVDNSMKREKGKWHKWISEIFVFFQRLNMK